LIIVEPSFESMALAEKIAYMAQGMGISRIRAILNKVPTEATRDKMIGELNKRGVITVGTVFYDNKLNEAGFEGRVLIDSKAVENLTAVLDKLLAEAK